MTRRMPRLIAGISLLAALLLLGSIAVPSLVPSVDAQVTPLDDDDDDAPGLGNITGSPEAGAKPTDAGDRGGWAQLALGGLLLASVSFIGFRIWQQVRKANAQEVSRGRDV